MNTVIKLFETAARADRAAIMVAHIVLGVVVLRHGAEQVQRPGRA